MKDMKDMKDMKEMKDMKDRIDIIITNTQETINDTMKKEGRLASK
jgi:hypothetical protein